jgi:hypothetical protein
MINRSILNPFLLAVLGAFLGLGSLAHADNPLLNDAADDLHQALNPGGDVPSVADRTKLVQAALQSLQKVPLGGYHGHLKDAITFVQSALDALGKSDPDNKASEYIHEAWDEVREISE